MSRRTTSAATLMVLVVLALTAGLVGPSDAKPRPGQTELVTVSSAGEQGKPCIGGVATADTLLTCRSDWVTSLSASGRYAAFSSPATNLVPVDANLQADVFVHDREADITERVSVASNGSEALAPPLLAMRGSLYLSDDPSISADGRFIAFTSRAVNLVPGDTNNDFDIFVHDRKTNETERVSVNSQGEQTSLGLSAEAASMFPSISADGRFVSFSSEASNLVSDDANEMWDVFVHDRKTKDTERVSVATGGRESSAACIACVYGEGFLMSSISAGGRWVVFDALRTDLVEGDTNLLRDVFVHDRKSDRTERVSVASDGEEAVDRSVRIVRPNSWEGSYLSSSDPQGSNGRNISGNGRYVVFASTATNLVPLDTNGGDSTGFDDGIDVFVHDRKAHRTQRLSVVSTGEQDLIGSPAPLNETENLSPSISPDGRFVTWETSGFLVAEPRGAPVAGIEPGTKGILLHDLETGSTEFVSWMAAERPEERGGRGMAGGGSPDVSSGGRYVSYQSGGWHAEGTEDQNPDEPDVFLRDRGAALGVGHLGGAPGRDDEDAETTLICITSDICVPPLGAIVSSDSINDVDDVLTGQGANLYGVSLAYRPQYEDLFAAIELEHMPQVLPGLSRIFYGLRFEVEEKNFEVRATSLLGGTFGLFDCTTRGPACTKVGDLRGGYGTTGMRVVFSLPLDEIGLTRGGDLTDVTAFSGLGSYVTGVLDCVQIARTQDAETTCAKTRNLLMHRSFQ